MNPAFAYLRTSSVTNVDGDSPMRQRLVIMDYAVSHGLSVAQEFYDDAVKGDDVVDMRPGFRRMLAALSAGAVRTVIVEHQDRFARDLVVQETGLRLLGNKGVRVITASGMDLTDNSDPNRVLIRQLLGAVAQNDKARIVARLKGGRDRARAARGMTDSPIQAEVRRLVAERPTAAYWQIANMVHGAGHRTRTGGSYTPTQIFRIVKSCGIHKADARSARYNSLDNTAD